LSSIYLKT